MGGPDEQTSDMFSYLSPEQRVRHEHPLRATRRLTDEALAPLFAAMYSPIGRPSIPRSSCFGRCCSRRFTGCAASCC